MLFLRARTEKKEDVSCVEKQWNTGRKRSQQFVSGRVSIVNAPLINGRNTTGVKMLKDSPFMVVDYRIRQ